MNTNHVLLVLGSLTLASHARASSNIDPKPLQVSANCSPSWVPTFGGAPGANGPVGPLAAFDDGTGPALFAAGYFTSAGGADAYHIAKWNGSNWAELSGGRVDDGIHVLAVLDDGSGPALFAGGRFSIAGGVAANHIAKWNGSSWSALGSGMDIGSLGDVFALTTFDDGSGPALYAGGSFVTAGGVTVNHIAKWDGVSWSALGSGMDSYYVFDLAVFDDGSGPALYAGGQFTTAGGVAANSIAKWDGSSWSPLGSGVANTTFSSASVGALAVFNDGSGPALYAGGYFTTAGGVTANSIAKWSGSTWSAVGSGMHTANGSSLGSVSQLAVFSVSGGPTLYASGNFTTAGGVSANNITKWNGTTWIPLSSGVNNSSSGMAVIDFGAGPSLYVGGNFTTAGNIAANYIAKWNGATWSALGAGFNQYVFALTAFDDGAGPALYAGGSFETAGGVHVKHIAKWNGLDWSPLGGGLTGNSQSHAGALTVFDDGNGPALYVAGSFAFAGGVAADQIAKWNGSSWSSLANGFSQNWGWLLALTVFDDGSGPALYVGGVFSLVGGITTRGIAKWDGAAWSAVGGGVSGDVYSLCSFDDGSGPALYAGGVFMNAGGTPTNGIAKWDGSAWSALGSGLVHPYPYYAYVLAMTTFDDGSGLALYIGGDFAQAGGISVRGIAKWNGSNWSALGSGMNGVVGGLATFDDGSGTKLIASGSFTSASAVPARHIAKWDGQSWSAMGNGLDDSAIAFAVFNDSSGPALYVGGSSSDSHDSFLSKWGCPFLNSGTTYCTAGTTSHGCIPSITAAGTASATVGSGFTISVTNVEGQRAGVVFFGIDGQLSSPWSAVSTSTLCVKSPLQRMSALNSGGTSNMCDGLLSEDWNAYRAAHPGCLGQPFTGGETVWAQAWFRDPPSTKTTALSNGLVFAVAP